MGGKGGQVPFVRSTLRAVPANGACPPFRSRLPNALWLILAAGLVLRLLGAWCANLIFDERAHWALAQTIDFHPRHFHLVSRSLDHPLLSIYVLKLSSLLFGTSDLGLRVLHLVAGTLTVVPVYFLGKRIFSEKAGLWAAGLLAVDQFHATWSRVFMPEVLMLLFASLVLLQLLRTLENDGTGNFVLLGLLLGLAYLAKEPAILLIPVLWTYLLLTPVHRRLLRRPAWYLAHGVFLLVIAPDVLWNLAQGMEGYLYRDAVLAAEPLRPSMKSLSLYLGEVFRVLIGPDVLDKEYVQGNVYACHWAAGILYLAAVVAAVSKRKTPAVRLLLVAFFVVFVFFLIAPGGETFDPFWWASLSLIPAVLCAGWLLDWASGGGKLPAIGAFLLLGYLGAGSVTAAMNPGRYEPRATVHDFAGDFIDKAHLALSRDDLREAKGRFSFVLNISGPNAEAYYGLALVARRRGQPEKAKSLLSKCLELDPNHPAAIQLLDQVSSPPPDP